jgi:hypothetical protein
MAQPTAQDIFGQNVFYDEGQGNFQISSRDLQNSGLSYISEGSPIPILAAILKTASEWLENNQDEAVKATCSTYSSSPVNRNGIDYTEFNFSFSFFGSYEAPAFDPDELI